jgi:hypothetical protein
MKRGPGEQIHTVEMEWRSTPVSYGPISKSREVCAEATARCCWICWESIRVCDRKVFHVLEGGQDRLRISEKSCR